MQTILLSVSGSVILLLLAIVAFFLRSIYDKITDLDKSLGSLKNELAKDYITKNDYVSNTESHKEIWVEVNNVKERLAKVEK